jgi:hypothetical protein
MKRTKFLNYAAAGVMVAVMGFAGCSDPEQELQTNTRLSVTSATIEATANADT